MTRLFNHQLDFIRSGKAFFTVVSVKSGVRFDYRVTAADNGGWFVSVQTGDPKAPDAWKNYKYIGFIQKDGQEFRMTKGSTMPADAKPVVAFEYVYRHLCDA